MRHYGYPERQKEICSSIRTAVVSHLLDHRNDWSMFFDDCSGTPKPTFWADITSDASRLLAGLFSEDLRFWLCHLIEGDIENINSKVCDPKVGVALLRR